MPRLERGLSGVEPERRPSALPHPNSAPALPRHARPCHAAPRPAKSVLVGGVEPPIRPSELPATYVAPCLASPRPATPGLATPCRTPSVRAPDSNRRVCHPRYRSKEPKPCHARHGRATACRVVPNHATRCLAASVRGQGVEPHLRPSTPPTQEARSSLSKRSFNAATSASV